MSHEPDGETLRAWCDRCLKFYSVNDCPRCFPPAASGEPDTANQVLMQVTHLLRVACDPDHWEDDRQLMLDIIEKFRAVLAASGGASEREAGDDTD